MITVESCRILTAHIPRDDVSYQGGVDVRGKPVKPADLYERPDFGLKDKISFALILDVAANNQAGAKAQKQFQEYPGLQGDVYLGQIVVKEGKATLDGKPLAGGDRTALYRFCAKHTKTDHKNKVK